MEYKVREEREKRDKARLESRKQKKGFRLNRSGEESSGQSDEETGDERKRPSSSPGVSGPYRKASKKFLSGQDPGHLKGKESRTVDTSVTSFPPLV